MSDFQAGHIWLNVLPPASSALNSPLCKTVVAFRNYFAYSKSLLVTFGGYMARARLYANNAEKMAAYRLRHAIVPLTVEIPSDLFDRLGEYMKFKEMTKNQVISHLIEKQLLRKR